MKKLLFLIPFCLLFYSCQKDSNTSNPSNPSATTPVLTTVGISAIANSTALSGGNISSDGGATITARGICWSTTTGPLVSGNHTTDGTGTGSFISNMTALSASTTYYVRAYATNSAGTSYGNELSFATAAAATLATVTTASITNISSGTATGGGEVLSNGGLPVTARGICWSTTVNPVVSGNHTTDGAGNGVFISSLTSLNAGTTYHVRAYATNSMGTAYGADISFSTTGSTTADVYVAGYEGVTGIGPTNNTDVKYWKNGVATLFTNGTTISYCNNIYVSGTDVYIAGMEFFSNGVNFHWTVMLWKNGIATPLATNTNYAEATSVFVSGTDVYVSGYLQNASGGGVVKLWKNGVSTDLTTGATSAQSGNVFVSGTDVYVAGRENNSSGVSIAKYWKNGVPAALTSGTNYARAEGIFVSGTDVYVSGEEQSATSYYAAKIWKNGVPTSLTTGATYDGYAHDVVVSGSDVYICGQEFVSGSGNSVAKTWKNGVVTNLTNGTTIANAQAIKVKGTDVYTAGNQFNGSYYNAVYWKNGVITILSNGAGGSDAKGIFVQ